MVGVLLARLFGHSLESVLGSMGLKNPILIWVLAPIVMFLIGVIALKVVGLIVHRKVDLYYKYKAGDLRQALWKRLNARVGIGVGLLNGMVYLILISMVIYDLAQVTVQLTPTDKASWMLRFANTAGRHLQGTGMSKVAAAVDPMPASYYEAADLAGLLYHNVLLEARLSRYPAFLSLGEKDVFQAIGNDASFTELRQRQPPVSEILSHPSVQTIVNDPNMIKQIWSVAKPNFKDLEKFLRTGDSDKYASEKLVGRWEINLNASLLAVRRERTNISSSDMRRLRTFMTIVLEKTTLVVTPEPEKQAILKNVGRLPAAALSATPAAGGQRPGMGAPSPRGGPSGRRGAPPTNPTPTPGPAAAPPPLVAEGYEKLDGQWTGGDTMFQLKFGNRGTFSGAVDGDRLTVNGYNYPMVFDRMY
jgi:hypothetical protein